MPAVVMHHGDCLEVLPTLPAGMVQTIVTSPPYWGMRDYGIPPRVWADGEAHILGLESLHDCLGWARDEDPCPRCYVCHMRIVASALWTVLRDDGTLFLNLGDCYANDTKWGGRTSGIARRSLHGQPGGLGRTRRATGLPPKSLAGMPWRVALALQADGWTLRNDVIWQKDNAKPESPRDRFSRDHEYLFVLTKGPAYVFDVEAVKEPCLHGNHPRHRVDNGGVVPPGASPHRGLRRLAMKAGDLRRRRTVWRMPTRPRIGHHIAAMAEEPVTACILAGSRPGDIVLDPFAGSGTTGLAALWAGRDAWLIEQSVAYVEEMRARLAAHGPSLFLHERSAS